MFIQTESTPNPNSLKFILDDYEICPHPIEFSKSQASTNSLLADELFKIDGIDNILFNKNYISVNKSDFTWDQLKASILQIISNHINSGLPAVEINAVLAGELESIEFDNADKEVVNNRKY